MLDLGGRYHQVAYVTNDIERGLDIFATEYGMPRFFRIATADLPDPDGAMPSFLIAFARVRGIEIEIIQPISGPEPLFSDMFLSRLPKDGGFGMYLHHMAVMVSGGLDDWERYRAGIDQTQHPIVFSAAVADRQRLMFTDDRRRLGHFIEHVWMSPEHRQFLDSVVPNYPT